MRVTTVRFNRNIKQFVAAVSLIAATGSTYAEDTAANVQKTVKQQSKSAIKRQEIQKKVANREPLSYEETLYLR